MMHPRLYMQSFQFATFNPINGIVAFETRLACGRRYSFSLTINQFLALNDVLVLIESQRNAYGHYPLGQGLWMHYNFSDASLYKESKDFQRRIDFVFASFREYKKYAHKRLLSLVRKEEREAAAAAATTIASGNGRGKAKGNVRSDKRPLSIVLQRKHQSPSPKRSCGEQRQALSRASNDGDMSYNDEESTIFPEWNNPNTRRWCKSFPSFSSPSKSLSTPENVQLSLASSFDPMESE